MKKSQKDATMLAETVRMKVNEKRGAASVTRVSKLESHLMYQWRSLFQRMTDIWEDEGNQLVSPLVSFTYLICDYIYFIKLNSKARCIFWNCVDA